MWRREEVLATIKGEAIGALPEEFTDVSIDSRALKQGAIFFAIQGNKFDGHDFLADAAQKGAALLIVQKDKAAKAAKLGVAFIAVKDVLAALEQLARKSRERSSAKIIAVTGSVGKTTLKELLKQILQNFGHVHASPASFNNHWGVPLTLATMPRETQYGVFELGMNHAGELAHLASMVQQDISIITAIAPAHLGNFSSIQDIAAAKAEIYTAQNRQGLALLNIDDVFCDFLIQQAKQQGIKNIEFFGKGERAQYKILEFKEHLLRFSRRGDVSEIKLNMAREYAAYNSMVVMAVLGFLQLDIRGAEDSLAKFSALSGRGKEYELTIAQQQKALLIDESYNANPCSMANAIANLGKKSLDADGRKIAVLGDMLELGAFAKLMHEALAEPLTEANIDKIYLIGSQMQSLAQRLEQPCIWRASVNDILPIILADIHAGDVIMIKSSKTIGTNMIVNELLNRYGLNSKQE